MIEGAYPVVLAAPSGTGKTTVAHRLVEGSNDFVFSVSATTRPPREGERDGVDYHFVDRAGFESMVEAGELVEWAEVHGRLYGTPRAEIEVAAGRGVHVVLDIDVQGALQIRDALPEAKLIFVLPPSVEALVKRLRGRGTEEEGEVARRLRSALDELSVAPDFDHLIVNDDVDRCAADVRAIVTSGESARREVPKENIEVLRAGVARILEREYEHING
jgi:guanylate kinase